MCFLLSIGTGQVDEDYFDELLFGIVWGANSQHKHENLQW